MLCLCTTSTYRVVAEDLGEGILDPGVDAEGATAQLEGVGGGMGQTGPAKSDDLRSVGVSDEGWVKIRSTLTNASMGTGA